MRGVKGSQRGEAMRLLEVLLIGLLFLPFACVGGGGGQPRVGGQPPESSPVDQPGVSGPAVEASGEAEAVVGSPGVEPGRAAAAAGGSSGVTQTFLLEADAAWDCALEVFGKRGETIIRQEREAGLIVSGLRPVSQQELERIASPLSKDLFKLEKGFYQLRVTVAAGSNGESNVTVLARILGSGETSLPLLRPRPSNWRPLQSKGFLEQEVLAAIYECSHGSLLRGDAEVRAPQGHG